MPPDSPKVHKEMGIEEPSGIEVRKLGLLAFWHASASGIDAHLHFQRSMRRHEHKA
jgi:hypothetical protein